MSLNGLLDQLVGGLAGAAAPQSGGGFSGKQMAGAAAASGLAGLLMGGKSGRKMAKNVAVYGGLAALGAVAYKAYRDHQAGKAPAAPAAAPERAPANSAFLPPPAAQEDRARALVRAMIAAAKADGHIDAEERKRIAGQIDALGLDAPDREFVFEELTAPLDVAAVAAGADGPEAAAEIYAASLLCIDVDSAQERRYLDDLAARMGVAPDLARHIEINAAG